MRQRRAIVFDDDPIILDLFKQYFQFKGYEVFAFSEPFICTLPCVDAISCPDNASCADLMVIDYMMPQMTGLQMLVEQKKRNCRLPMDRKALISGYLDSQDLRIIGTLGCAFFPKPLSLARFSDWVAACEKTMDLSQPLGTMTEAVQKLRA